MTERLYERLRGDIHWGGPPGTRERAQEILDALTERDEDLERLRSLLPDVPPGTSIRLERTEDGWVNRGVLRPAGTRTLDDGAGGTLGPQRAATILPLWADVPSTETTE